jgi:ribose transport system substrate-binding protein
MLIPSNQRVARGAAVVGLLLTTATGLAACGSSSSASDARSSGSGETVTPAAQSAPGLAAAQKIVTAASDSKVNVTTPVGKPIPTGKSVIVVSAGVQAALTLDQGVQAGGKALGWNVTTKLVGVGSAAEQAAYAAALQAHPDAVVASGVYPTVAELRALRQAGIKVAGIGASPSTYYNLEIRNPPWQELQGRIATAWMATDAKGAPAVVGMVNVVDLPSIVEIHQGVAASLPQYCAKCKLKTLNISYTSIGTDATARITNWLRANPDINYLFLPIDTVLNGLPAALSAAGVQKLKIVSFFATQISIPYLKSGEEAAAIGTADFATGWQAIDALARVFTNQSPAVDENPLAVSPTLSTGSAVTAIPTGPAGYQAAFERLWGR